MTKFFSHFSAAASVFLEAWDRRSVAWMVLFLNLLSPIPGHAQVAADWTQGPGGVTVAGDGLGNVYTARYDMNPAGDILLIKHNSNGVEQWQAGYDQTDVTKWEQAVWVDCDPSGNPWSVAR